MEVLTCPRLRDAPDRAVSTTKLGCVLPRIDPETSSQPIGLRFSRLSLIALNDFRSMVGRALSESSECSRSWPPGRQRRGCHLILRSSWIPTPLSDLPNWVYPTT